MTQIFKPVGNQVFYEFQDGFDFDEGWSLIVDEENRINLFD